MIKRKFRTKFSTLNTVREENLLLLIANVSMNHRAVRKAVLDW